jgi:hypothetical protein
VCWANTLIQAALLCLRPAKVKHHCGGGIYCLLSKGNRRKHMRIALILTLAAASALPGCTTISGPVEVTRFNRTAEGQSYGKGGFMVRAALMEPGRELSTSPYITAVRQEMQRAGYTDAAGKDAVIAEVNYAIDYPENRPGRSPVSVGVGGSSGGYRSGVGVGVGIDLTNLINKPKPQVITTLSVRILSSADNMVIWEGKATQQASMGTPAAQPGIAAGKLASALFSGFPGKSGETITVK